MRGSRVLDFGCGAHRPASMALLFYLCGARQVLGVDVEDIFDVGSVAAGILAEIMSILFGKPGIGFERIGESREAILRRLSAVDFEALLRGDLRAGLPQSIQWRNCYFEELPQEEREFDAMFSHCVFEHVADVYGTLAQLRENISPRGFMVVVIDFKDHRCYAGTAKSWFQYLMDDSDHEPGYINKVRYTEFIEIAKRAGFANEATILETINPSAEERAQFLPKYESLSERDITTSGARILFRPL